MSKRFLAFLKSAGNQRASGAVRVTIHVLGEVAQSGRGCEAVARLLRAIATQANTDIVVHLRESAADWVAIAQATAQFREALSEKKGGSIAICGPLHRIDETVKDAIASQEVRLYCACGWWKDCPADAYTGVPTEVLRDLSKYGLLVPTTWYVHAQNINAVEAGIAQSRNANYHAGFSLPPIYCNPYYSFGAGEPELPDGIAYAQLLVQTYEAHPHNDDVFAPLAELADALARGAWHSDLQIPQHIKVLVDGEGSVKVFRHIPAFAQSWRSLDDIVEMTPPQLTADLFAFHLRKVTWDEEMPCFKCDWRYVCGGSDRCPAGILRSPERLFQVNCAYRVLFLQAFAWAKWKMGWSRPPARRRSKAQGREDAPSKAAP